ncbi:hypothetical protein [Flavobacterium sp.]|uniref:hypothetical protein n=1 Tax=Flavobacterium sp. TaxID=239 RepID=UPI002633FD69|nr:hypothetical protein [Flavobacterium sp.]MDD3004809.1 hypothetical protein [Flavobacterium sp.]
MRWYFFLFIIGCSTLPSFAQFDGGNNPLNIPPANLPKMPSISPEKKPSLFDIKPKEDAVSNPWDKPKAKVFNQQDEFINPADRYTKKMNNSLKGEGKGDYKIFRRNQYFGDFKTKSEKIQISVRDPQAIDGDYVKITHDGKVIYESIFLDAAFKTIEIPLNIGFNRIEFIALNEGISFPNTGAFLIRDNGYTVYQEEWNLSTGFNASFLIIRE